MRRTIPAILLPLLLGLLALPGPARAGEEDLGEALEGLSGAAALEMVKELAADAMKGRRTGFEGGTLVENWIIGKFSEFGLHPADAAGTYLEPFTFMATKVTEPITFTLGGEPLKRGEDYLELTQTGGGDVDSAEVVFCGYGIERPDAGWNDYANTDVKGKVVLAMRGAPPGREAELHEERYIGYKSAKALEKGARGFLLVEKEKAQGGTILQRYARKDIPGLWISSAVADRILAGRQTTLKELKKKVDDGGTGHAFATGARVDLKVKVEWLPRAKGHNALGAIKGRDPDLADEVILVGAHMDHLGVGADGQVFNGADDNASGTAVLTHLADILTANRWRPKRTVIFCGFGAEEQGLVGSYALAARYPFKGRVVCMLNMDMVGQGEPKVHIGGGGAYPAMENRLRAFLPKELQETTTFRPRAGPGSDNWPFYERGIPAFFVATKGPHPNYHSPKDDVENIQVECLAAAARTVGALVVRLGNHPEPLTDPLTLPAYLLREGPTFESARLQDGKLQLDSKSLDDLDASALIVTVDAGQDPAAAWQALEDLARPKDSAYVLVRRARDIQRAFRSGRVALLPRLMASGTLPASPSKVFEYARLGYRWIAPWRPATASTPRDAERTAQVLRACKEAKVLVELGPGMSHAEARVHLGTWPAIEQRLGSWSRERRQPDDSSTLLLEATPDVAWLDRVVAPDHPAVVTLAHPAWAERLQVWGATQPAGWDLPGSPQRKAIRAALGGRLVEWLRRLER